MKTKLLLLGTLFCLLVATPLYAQETRKMEKKEMTQPKIVNPPKVKVVPKKKRVVHGHIDPITGEEIPPYTTGKSSEKFVILFPTSSLYYPNSNWYVLGDGTIPLHGEAPGGHTIEVKMLREHNGNYTMIKDWTPFSVHQEGYWGAGIDWDGVSEGQGVKLKLLVRDTADRSEVKTLILGRE